MCAVRVKVLHLRRGRGAKTNGRPCERRQTVMKWLFIPVSSRHGVNKHAVRLPLIDVMDHLRCVRARENVFLSLHSVVCGV